MAKNKNTSLSENALLIKKRITRNTIIISILVMILVSILSFIMSVEQVSATFADRFNILNTYLDSWDNLDRTSFEELDLSLSYSPWSGYSDDRKDPVVIAFYSKDGELKNISGSVMDIDDVEGVITIDMDPYLTPDIMVELKKFMQHKKWSELNISNCKYYKEDGKIVPVEATFEILKYGEEKAVEDEDGDLVYETQTEVVWSKTIKFSDKAHTYSGEVYGFNIIDKSFPGARGKIYKDLYEFAERQNTPGEMIFDRIIFSYQDPSKDLAYNENNILHTLVTHWTRDRAYAATNVINLNGEEGYFTIAAGQNVYAEALKNLSFTTIEITSIIIILLASLIIRRALVKTSLKNLETEESKRAFMSATAHELKTPIAIIQNQAELILENISPEKTSSYAESIYEEARRMDGIVRTLQQYDKINAIDSVNESNFNLSEVIKEETEKYSRAFDEKNIEVSVHLPDSCIVRGDDNLISLVVDNYLSNAWKYTESGGRVEVMLEYGNLGGRSVFSVTNTCTPFSEDELKSVWDIMYKGDKSRTRGEKNDSGGMGLAVCKRILDLHGYTYGCDNTEDGVSFYFRTDKNV